MIYSKQIESCAQFNRFHDSNWIEWEFREYDLLKRAALFRWTSSESLFENNLLQNWKEMQQFFSSSSWNSEVIDCILFVSHFQSQWLHQNIQFGCVCVWLCVCKLESMRICTGVILQTNSHSKHDSFCSIHLVKFNPQLRAR